MREQGVEWNAGTHELALEAALVRRDVPGLKATVDAMAAAGHALPQALRERVVRRMEREAAGPELVRTPARMPLPGRHKQRAGCMGLGRKVPAPAASRDSLSCLASAGHVVAMRGPVSLSVRRGTAHLCPCPRGQQKRARASEAGRRARAQKALDLPGSESDLRTVLANAKHRRWNVVGGLRVLLGSEAYKARPALMRYQAHGRAMRERAGEDMDS